MSFKDLSSKTTVPPKDAANDGPKTAPASGEPGKAATEEAAKPKKA